jgi:hypothetical protein
MVTDNSKVSNEARNARRLDPRPTAFEAAQLIKPPALRGVSDSHSRMTWTGSQNPDMEASP